MFKPEKPKNDQSWRIGNGFTQCDPKYDSNQTYITGKVFTVHGIVCFYTSWADKHPMTDIQFTFNGKFFRRFWLKTFPQRTISTIAKRFIKEIVEREELIKGMNVVGKVMR